MGKKLRLKVKKPWIGYCGSPIQQNYSEKLDHGYLFWNIKNSLDWNVEFRHLPNPCPFVTIDWSENLEKTLQLAKKYPKGSRFRIRSQNQITQDDIHLISESLKTSHLASEVTFKSEFNPDKQTVKTGSSTFVKSNLRSPDVIMKLLKDYHNDINFVDDDISCLSDQIKNHLSTVSQFEDFSRNSKWNLRGLKWDNLFSYGKGNSINFDKLNGIIGIFGPNRIGKSSIVGSLMYVLFNTTDRGSLKNINICNVRKPYCSAQAVIDHNGSTYVIERQTTKSANKRGSISASTSLNLFRMKEDGDMEDLCGEQRTDTEKTLKSLFGNTDDFLMTSFSAQGEINYFISQTSNKRRAILSRFLDIDIFDRLYEVSIKEVNGIKSQLKNFPDRDWDELQKQKKELFEKNKIQILDLDEKILESQKSLDSFRQQLSTHKAIPVTKEDLDFHEKKANDFRKKSEECRSTISQIQNEIEELKEKFDSLQKIIESNNIVRLRELFDSQRQLEISVSEIKYKHEKEQTILGQQQKSLKILDEVPCEDKYPNCRFIKDAHSNKKNIDLQIKKVSDLLELVEKNNKSLEKFKDATIQAKIEKYEKAESLATKINLEIAKKEIEIEKNKSSCNSCFQNLVEIEEKISLIKEALKNEENAEVIYIRKKMEELSAIIKQCDMSRLEIASQQGKLSSDIEILTKEREQRNLLLKSLRLHEIISSGFSKKGIPLLVTKSQLPIINAEISRILQGIVDFTVELENDEDTDSLEIYIDYGDSRRIIELCSGMEKTIAALSLRVAMINVSSLPKPNFFVIDEGFGTLDNAGIESCNRLLASLKRHFKSIIVITHVDGIKDSADHILEITKQEIDSKLEHE